MSSAVEHIMKEGNILAILIKTENLPLQGEKGKLWFPTPEQFPLQVGVHHREEQETVAAHRHLPFPELRNLPVQEFFYVISGKVKVDLYGSDEKKHCERVLTTGDCILLNTAHGLTFLEKTKLIELKQGPYRGKEQEKKYL